MRYYTVRLHPVLALLFLLICPAGLQLKAQENVITFDVGSFTVTLLSEGDREGKTTILTSATAEMLKQTVPHGTFSLAVNAFLVETEERSILFDTGTGKTLFENLEICGKAVEDINVIMLTHMHGDHIGGLLRNDEKSFPLATLYIPQPEYDYWMSDEAMQKLPENQRGSFINARHVIHMYEDKLQLFTPGETDATTELIPGIRSISAYGHTPGHTGYLLESDGSKMLIWGDLTHAMAIQIPYPEVAVTYDTDPVMAVKSRLQIFKYVSENNIRIAGMHIPYPGIGDVIKNKFEGYEFMLICDCEGRYP